MSNLNHELKLIFNPPPAVHFVRFNREDFIPYDCAIWLRDHMYKIPNDYEEEDGHYIFKQISDNTVAKRKYNYSYDKIIGSGISLGFVSYLL